MFGGQGLVAATSDDADLHLARTDFGRPWHLRDELPKLYPSCFGTHAAIECALRLRKEAGGADVRDVELTFPPVLLQVCAVARPATGLEGKFSLTFTTALAWPEGAVTVDRLRDDAVGEPALKALADRVRLRCDASLPNTATRMRVRLEDGRELRTEADSTSRRWMRDPTEVWPTLTSKFTSLAAPALGAAGAERVPRRRWSSSP
ncbi:hypothetical protein ACI8AF_02480 [Blastococcus sp. SYSU D00669]